MPYPTELDDLTTAVPTGGSTDHEEHTLAVATAVEALQAKVGTGASTPTAGTVLTGTGAGVASWQPGLRESDPVTLSSAQLLDLHNTPVTLVAAPGAGKYLLPHRVSSYYTYGTTPYAGPDVPQLVYEVTGALAALMGALDEEEDRIYAPGSMTAISAGSSLVNTALQAFATAGAITGGDGTLTVTVWYSVEDVP